MAKSNDNMSGPSHRTYNKVDRSQMIRGFNIYSLRCNPVAAIPLIKMIITLSYVVSYSSANL